LKQGLLEKVHAPVAEPVIAGGLADTLDVLAEWVARVEPAPASGGREPPVAATGGSRPPLAVLADLRAQLGELPGNLLDWDRWLERFAAAAEVLVGRLRGLAAGGQSEASTEAVLWAQRLAAAARGQLDELRTLAPWLRLFREPGQVPQLFPHFF